MFFVGMRLGGEPLNFPYWDVSLFWLVRKRIGWLMFLFFGVALTSAVIGKFESQLESVIILFPAVFMYAGGIETIGNRQSFVWFSDWNQREGNNLIGEF